MQSENYFLVLSGTLIEGHDRAQVERGLQRLLGVSAERAKEMLAGKRSRIRKPLPLDKARHLRDKLVACGAGSFIEPVDRKAAREAERAAASDNAQQLAATEQAASAAGGEGDARLDDAAAELPVPDEQIDQPEEEEIVLSTGGPPQATPAAEPAAQAQDLADLALEPLVVETEQQSAPGDEAERQPAGDDHQAEPEIDQEATRPLEAVEVIEEESIEVVLESRLEPLQPVSLRPTQPSADEAEEPEPAGNTRSGVGKPLLMAAGGLLIVLAAAAGGWYFFAGSEPARPPVEAQVAPIAPTSKVVTAQRLKSLERAIRAWIKFYGSGAPAQVSLDRLSQDLEMAAEELLDGWGSKIAYQPEQNGYTLVSAGPDRKHGTGDDIARHSKLKTD